MRIIPPKRYKKHFSRNIVICYVFAIWGNGKKVSIGVWSITSVEQ